MSDEPWYQDGLKFKCTQCGACCTGETGYVWVNKQEVGAIAELRGESVEEVLERYVRRVGVRHSLLERTNGDCVFYDRRHGCTVYAARPRQCRSWPFWDSNLNTRQAWEQTCRECPGAGNGTFFSLEEIQAQAALIRI
jgi:hypothetical protein